MFSNYYHNIPLHAFFYRWKYNKHLIYYTIKLILPLSNVCFTITRVGENVGYLFLYTCTNDELRAYAKTAFLLLYPLTHIIPQYWQLHFPTLSETFLNISISVNRIELYQDRLDQQAWRQVCQVRVVRPFKSYCVTAEHVETPNLS